MEGVRIIQLLIRQHGLLKKWLALHHPKTKEEWVKLFKKTFKFTGGEIVNKFLMSIGYLRGAHSEECAIYKEVLKQNPMWCNG